MKTLCPALTALALVWPAASYAQAAPPSPPIPRPATYQIEYDSLQVRAARVRTRVEAQISNFRSSFAALGGLSRRTKSYGHLLVPASARSTSDPRPVERLVKKQVAKSKTEGAQVEKVFYYSLSGRMLLAEYYAHHLLVKQELYEYPRNQHDIEYHRPFRTTLWVRGDYLQLSIQPRESNAPPLRFYFSSSHRPD